MVPTNPISLGLYLTTKSLGEVRVRRGREEGQKTNHNVLRLGDVVPHLRNIDDDVRRHRVPRVRGRREGVGSDLRVFDLDGPTPTPPASGLVRDRQTNEAITGSEDPVRGADASSRKRDGRATDRHRLRIGKSHSTVLTCCWAHLLDADVSRHSLEQRLGSLSET